MVYVQSPLAIGVFLSFVLLVLGLSFYFARKTKSSSSYFAAGGSIHWGVNGIAFAGDYLSAASFLGICGMIATVGYDGFLYSIGYLAGWIVALFVVAEAMKRLGKYTFSDALDAKFGSKAIRGMAALSTLVVSVFYLIPQMVGAGVLVKPLLGLPYAAGVAMVGAIVIVIVATAGMTSTTYVQFIKGALLIFFSTILVGMVLVKGITSDPKDLNGNHYKFSHVAGTLAPDGTLKFEDAQYKSVPGWAETDYGKQELVLTTTDNGEQKVFSVKVGEDGAVKLDEAMAVSYVEGGKKLYNFAPASEGKFHYVGHMNEIIQNGKTVEQTGPVGPFEFLRIMQQSSVVLWGKKSVVTPEGKVDVYYQKVTPGSKVLRPGLKFKVDGATTTQKLNFISLMLALFCGTAALPHILIRYYTVPNPAAARKSTIVAIAAIAFFYILTLYLGLGSMTNGVINIADDNMSGPLLAQSFGLLLFACISAIAFATVLGTVSGLIVAATGAIAHDVVDILLQIKMTDKTKVLTGKVSALVVGLIAIWLGIQFEGMNVSFLVGWAFAVAASANLPAIIMILFWKRVTKQGITASIITGMVSAVGLILLSPDMYVRYGKLAAEAPITLDNPGIISIPLSFAAGILVSLITSGTSASQAEKRA